MNLYYFIFFTIVIVYIIGSFFIYIFKTNKFMLNIQLYRKLFYILLVIGIGIGIFIGEIDLKNWKLLLELTALFVFIDIAVFQTPDISKIWNAEFSNNSVAYFKKLIESNDRTISYHVQKAMSFTQIIQNTETHFENKNVPLDWQEYQDEIGIYLSKYTEKFQFNTVIYPINNSEESIKHVFRDFEICYNKSIVDAEYRNTLITDLLNGKSIELKSKDEDSKTILSEDTNDNIFIVAFYGKRYSMLIGLSSKIVDVEAIDAFHILNLCEIFDWYMMNYPIENI